MVRLLILLGVIAALLVSAAVEARADSSDAASPRFSRHVEALFSRLGCNAGVCHGAVQGQNGFRLTLFAADPTLDHQRLVREFGGRRVNIAAPEASLLLLKATAQVPHRGSKRMTAGSPEYEMVRRWIASGAGLDRLESSRVVQLRAVPAEKSLRPGQGYRLRAEARFADGSIEDVTSLCSFTTLDRQVATVTTNGTVTATGPGDTGLIVRYRAEPVLARVVVPRASTRPILEVGPHNFIDGHILAKLRRLNIPPAPLADDATFLRRASLDVTGELPTAAEIRAFLASKDPDKRAKKIDELLSRPGYCALWALKFCDLLKASDFGVYADALSQEADAPRFYHWIRARLQENIPYDELAERILTATSREGRDLAAWAAEVNGLFEGFTTPRTDLALYDKRRTLDLYWQRRAATGVPGAIQIAHTFLGLRLECAQCHRHPHDVWQQDDLLSFANFFMRVREPGFQGDNEKKYPQTAALARQLDQEAKKLTEEVKQQRAGRGKQLEEAARKARPQADRLRLEMAQRKAEADRLTEQAKRFRAEADRLPPAKQVEAQKWIGQAVELETKAAQARREAKEKARLLGPLQAAVAAYEKFVREVGELERRSRLLPEVGRRLMHAEIQHLPSTNGPFATVASPLGTQTSAKFRLLGESRAIEVPAEQDPRALVGRWMRRPDNPFFARAIVNRVWAHYFGRGIIDPPDNLSSFNPPSHPELLQELCREFIRHGYDLKWLHRSILLSRTYQQSGLAGADNALDRSNYAYFYYRRLGAEVLLDALDQATGTGENMGMRYWHWPDRIKAVEIPFRPANPFVTFMLEHFGRPARNSAVQCDCERDGNASILQVLSFANHPRVWQKIADNQGRVARILRAKGDDGARVEETFLWTLSRLPTEGERGACLRYMKESGSPQKGLQGVMWSLLNTREFLLQH
jgi:hypothetical protein